LKLMGLGCSLISATAAVITQIPASVDAGYAATNDRYGVKAGIVFGNTMFFLSVICLIFIKHQPFLYLMAILFGFGTCIGSGLFPGIGLGGPLIASAYDLTGSYNIAWIIVAALAVVMTAFLLYSYRVSRICIKKQEEEADTAKNTA